MTASSELTLQSVIQRRPKTIESEVDGEVVALNIDKGQCYGLNKLGSHVWKMLVVPVSVDQICTELLEEYDVDRATCEQQVLELLAKLENYELVEVGHPPAGAET